MKIGKRFLIIGLLALLAFQSSLVIASYFRTAILKTPFGWQDEGYVLGPALQVYEKGWSSYRCRGDQVICYGTVHTFFDVLVLKALPESWVKDSALLVPPGPEWFYQSKYPNAFVALRTFRVVLAILFLGLIGGIAARSFRSISYGFIWALALPSFDAFRASRMGLKNDFSFSLYLVLFLLLANWALADEEPRRARAFFIGAVVVGTVGISVKFGIILPFVALIPAYLLSSRLRGLRISALTLDLLIAGISALLVFVITNPNLGISLGEANWFSSFLVATGRIPTANERMTEFLSLLTPNLWPLPFLLFFILIRLRKGSRGDAVRWIYLGGVPVIWTILTWKASYLRSAYYLPILTWTLVVGTWIPKLPRFTIYIFAIIFGYQAVMSIAAGLGEWRSFQRTGSIEPWQLFQCGSSGCAEGRWIVDRTLRAAVPRDLGESRVLFFDSLTDSPAELATHVRAKWPDFLTNDPHFLATCWSDPPSSANEPLEYYSPAGERWAKLLRSLCSRTIPIGSNAAFAYENGWRPSAFASTFFSKVMMPEIKVSGNEPLLEITRNGLSPRMLAGSWQGIDSWYAPVILKSDAVLESEFIFPEGATDFTIPIETTCKGEGSVVFDFSAGKIAQSADTRMELCQKRPWVCRLGLGNWWTERIPLVPVINRGVIPRGAKSSIRITVRGGNPDRCRISIGTIRFKPVPLSARVEK